MQLKLQRSQRVGGLTASTIYFCLDLRADYTEEERSNINRYKLGSQIIYSSRAAQKHLESAGTHLSSTQEGSTGSRIAGLARGATSLALAKMQLNISIASLGRGHHIECKDMEELLESEDTVRAACKNLTRYLEIASTFDGSELVIEYANGEENIHISRNATPLLESGATADVNPAQSDYDDGDRRSSPSPGPGQSLGDRWDELARSGKLPRYILLACIGLVVFILLRSCIG